MTFVSCLSKAPPQPVYMRKKHAKKSKRQTHFPVSVSDIVKDDWKRNREKVSEPQRAAAELGGTQGWQRGRGHRVRD